MGRPKGSSEGKVVSNSEKKTPPPGSLTKKGIAEQCQVTEVTVQRWAIKPDFPKPIHVAGRVSYYDPAAVADWHRSFEASKREAEAARKESQRKESDLDEAKAKLILVRAAHLELKYRREQGELVQVSKEVAFFERTLASAQAAIRHLPGAIETSLPPDLPPGVVTQIREAVRKACNSFQLELLQLLKGDADETLEDDEDD